MVELLFYWSILLCRYIQYRYVSVHSVYLKQTIASSKHYSHSKIDRHLFFLFYWRILKGQRFKRNKEAHFIRSYELNSCQQWQFGMSIIEFVYTWGTFRQSLPNKFRSLFFQSIHPLHQWTFLRSRKPITKIVLNSSLVARRSTSHHRC